MTRRLLCAWMLVALFGATVAPAAAVEGAFDLRASIDMKSFVAQGERALVRFTLTNDSAADVYILQWQTPLRGIEHEIFDVRLNGEPVPYVGPHIKFGPPRPEHYLRIPAGEARSIRVDLGRTYDLSRTGEYTVQYKVNLQDVLREDGGSMPLGEMKALASNLVFTGIERDERGLRMLEDAAAPLSEKASTSFVKCNTSQQSDLTTARSNATSISSNSLSYLNGHTSSNAGPRYTTWFGALDSGRYSTAKSHFSSITSALQNAAMTFNCGCKKKYYAYVYPTQPYTIYLCSVFWSAPAMGTDSKAGTLVHETSHFNVVAGTDDHAYGQAACKNLATSDPVRAVDNADSHEYFAENTPALN